jgi:hypothetical protein
MALLPTNVATNDPAHAGIHNNTNAAINSLALPSDHGLLGWNFDPTFMIMNGGSSSAVGQIRVAKLKLPKDATITNLLLHLYSAGSGLTSGQCKAALYDSSLALQGVTADQSSAWATAGVKTMALVTPKVATAGYWFVAYWANGTSRPGVAVPGDNAADAMTNLGLSGNTLNTATSSTTATTTAPSSLAGTLSSMQPFWAGIS